MNNNIIAIIVVGDVFGCGKSVFLFRMRRLFMTSEAIDILCLVYSNFCAKKKKKSKVGRSTFTDLVFFCGELRIK